VTGCCEHGTELLDCKVSSAELCYKTTLPAVVYFIIFTHCRKHREQTLNGQCFFIPIISHGRHVALGRGGAETYQRYEQRPACVSILNFD